MSRRHLYFMLLCCLAPIIAIAALLVLRVPISTVALVALVLICPLSHLLMMRYTGHEPALTMNERHSQADE